MASGNSNATRRAVLKGVGAGGIAGLAGCLGVEDGGSGNGGTEGSGGSTDASGGTGGGGGSPDSIAFGQPAAQTGQWDFLQPGVSQATDAALQNINDAGGPLDTEVELVRRDTGVNPQEARTVVTQLVENDGASAILGLFSSEINPLWDFLQEQQTPVVTPWPGSTFLDTRGGDKGTPENLDDDEWVWRTVVGDTVHTAGNAKRTLDEGYETIGVINGNTEGERSYVEGFLAPYEAEGGSVAQRVEVGLGESSYQSALERLFGADFDAFLVSLPQESAITMLSDWADGGYGGQPVLSDTLGTQAVIDQVGDALNGAWAASPGQSGPNYDTFEQAFQNAGDAEVNAWSPPAWDAMHVVALAIERAGEATPEAIERNLGPVSSGEGTAVSTFAEGKEALANGEEVNFEGAATPTNFTQHGNVFGSVTISVAENGAFTEAEVIPAEEVRGFVEEGEY
ncbi:ABC transporter substrate-binding protein [Halogeometricum luteum]|uniref:ABC transporter substrate-binding protein n=1 Tax=Halogeometricum luteum TaxID=2950537 RepID=A0ABU2G3X4_9EURY|nr:ABC transporter substrate-binding protein [Halogeometricum sp. S3BR5-2]MDS0295492.1 ABC transporter substrate-binding protein [Halogeometricum sp. S3BR5-2]